MTRTVLVASLAALPLAAMALPATAQTLSSGPVVAAGDAVLTLTAEGKTTATPDLALFSAGVTTQAKSASGALSDNANKMNHVIAALKKAGIADRDIQTSNLSVNPVYAEQRPDNNGSGPREPAIVGYQATNQVQVKQRRVSEFGKVIDTLVSAGANQISGPQFLLDNPDAATDQARVEAVSKARARAELYAKASGLRVLRVLTISEGGGYNPQPMPVFAMAKAMRADAPSPVAAGELDIAASVTVTYELAPTAN
ncbi:SIMPL domain-containing protein [Novosphingobium sp. FKTRR1]|uniref:SIMPL domain-containing protein n=1 Tax=Novosphingobium sp. FKTRR1 TaxID=2879118 RepID=UPI001CF07675|nr:SIMPL domain-containing protein [Novosphingobium sp. FKTRR1]